MDASSASRPGEAKTGVLIEMAAALITNPPTTLTIVEVRDKGGATVLEGQVDTPQRRDELGQIALRRLGGAETINALEVNDQLT